EQVLKEVEETGNTTLVARNHGIPVSTIYTWAKSRRKSSSSVPSRELKSSNFNSNSYNKEIEKENDRLKKLLGEKDLEISVLKDLLKKTDRL
ncbi:MAG: transposase, partial [Clostridiales bacterium]|nr:transposase [Clostridiales bacterium]